MGQRIYLFGVGNGGDTACDSHEVGGHHDNVWNRVLAYPVGLLPDIRLDRGHGKRWTNRSVWCLDRQRFVHCHQHRDDAKDHLLT